MADTNNATKKKILSAAKVVFLEKGFDGARMQEIAKVTLLFSIDNLPTQL
jgi:AcrR family transcriptional regulator